MDVYYQRPADEDPEPVIVPLGNVTTRPAIVVLDDGRSVNVAPKPKRGPGRPRKETN